MEHDPSPGAPRTPALDPPAPHVAAAIHAYADLADRARAVRAIEEEVEFDGLVALGFTAEEARAIVVRRRTEALAEQVAGRRTEAEAAAEHRYIGYLAPGMVIVARHRDPEECGGTEHRWFVHGSLDGGQLRATNDMGQRWSIDSLDPAGMRVVIR